jgi:hypothetical protein
MFPVDTSESISRSPVKNRRGKLAFAALLAGYFLCFNWGSLRVHFALDDLGNIGHYYEYSSWQLVLSNFLPWRGDSRPLGGLFYIPIYHFAGLNPVPYQAVLLLLLLGNVYWVYRFAKLLGAGELAAGLVALACCYHAGVANLYYNAAFVFDVLCCFFYLASFVYYLRIRNRGQLPGSSQTMIFLGLFLCALNSKEMAVSIPVMLLIYEWIYHRPQGWSGPALLAWVRGPARVSLMAAVLDLVDIYGKVSGPTAMTNSEAYHPVFTLGRIHDFQRLAMQDLFFSWAWMPGWGQILALWAVLAFLAWRRAGRPVLRFLFWFLVVVPLPIEFLVGKSEACLVLLMVGGALFVAVVFADAAEWTARLLSRGFRLPPAGRHVLAGMMVAAAVFVWVRDQRHLRLDIGKDPMTTLGFQTWDLIEQLRASDFHARHGSFVVFLDDPFHNMDMYFLSRLWVHDRSVTVHVLSQGPLPPEELAKADYLFTIENRKLIRLK